MNAPPFAILLLSILIGAAGQIFFKLGARPDHAGELSGIFLYLRAETIIGFAAYGFSAILYIWSLRSLPLTLAYPTVALGYVIVVGVGAVVFAEAMSLQKIIAIVFIVFGVSLLWR
jgi:multidrug transporter EmrE-like cation transporter